MNHVVAPRNGGVWLPILLSLVLVAPARAHDTASTVPARRAHTIGIVPYFTADKIFPLYEPFIRHLNENTPDRWELKLGRTHDELVSGLCAGEIDIAYLGPVPFGKALLACDVQPLLLSRGADGKPFYRAVIATAEPRLGSLRDLRGRKFALFEKSTASYYLPLAMLAEEGLARRDLDPVFFVSQDKIVTALLAREVVAGGIKESLYEKFRGAGLRALKISEPLPQFVYAAGPRFPPEEAAAFTAALLRVQPLTREADRELVRSWDPELAFGFAAPTAGFRDDVLKLFRSLEPFLK